MDADRRQTRNSHQYWIFMQSANQKHETDGLQLRHQTKADQRNRRVSDRNERCRRRRWSTFPTFFLLSDWILGVRTDHRWANTTFCTRCRGKIKIFEIGDKMQSRHLLSCFASSKIVGGGTRQRKLESHHIGNWRWRKWRIYDHHSSCW